MARFSVIAVPSYRATLEASEVVRDPAVVADGAPEGPSVQRVCEACFDETNANADMPARLRRASSSTVERIVIDEQRLAIPRDLRRQESNSQISDLAEYAICFDVMDSPLISTFSCPVCGRNLSEFETAVEQETHVKACLEGGVGSVQQPARYLVYKLPAESLLVGTECESLRTHAFINCTRYLVVFCAGVICLEEFMKGSMVARLSCLCSFHNSKSFGS